jgi:hypothetical protein
MLVASGVEAVAVWAGSQPAVTMNKNGTATRKHLVMLSPVPPIPFIMDC